MFELTIKTPNKLLLHEKHCTSVSVHTLEEGTITVLTGHVECVYDIQGPIIVNNKEIIDNTTINKTSHNSNTVHKGCIQVGKKVNIFLQES